jgi:hypothetical protein
MRSFEVKLNKRGGKSVFYIIASVFLIFMLILMTKTIVANFEWYYGIFFALLLAGAYISLKGVYEFFMYKEVRLVAEADGEFLKLHCVNEKGKKFCYSEKFRIDEIARIYVVKQHTKFLYKNYYFEIVGKTKLKSILKGRLDVFPSLYDASMADINAVLAFIGSLRPGIQTGYENIFQKIVK